MPERPCCSPMESPHARNRHRTGFLAVVLVLGGGLAFIFYSYGESWWYAPLAVPGVVLAHMAILGGIAFIATRIGLGRRAPGRAACCQGGTEHPHEYESEVLHRPRHFDWLVRVIMLGRERKLRQWMLDLAELEPGNVVIDIGCGTGTLLLAAADRVGSLGALHGVEPSAEMAAHARHKAEARKVPLAVVEGSAKSLPYPPASFDAAFCTLVLHHLPRSMRDVAIRETRRVLRPGGRAVFIDWQRPKSLARAILSPLFLVYLLHNLGPTGSPLDGPGIEPLMKEVGFEDVARCSFGGGGSVGAVVGRVGCGNRAVDPAEAQNIAPVGYEA